MSYTVQGDSGRLHAARTRLCHILVLVAVSEGAVRALVLPLATGVHSGVIGDGVERVSVT